MIRATTNGVLKNYRSDLARSFTTLNGSRNTVLTQRNFNSYAEDPAAAAQAFQMRTSFERVSSQHLLSQSTGRKYDVAYKALLSIVDDVDNKKGDSSWTTVLEAMNEPTGGGRNALGQSLTQLAENMVQTMNAKYGDNYVFAGADGLNVPFTWDGNTLLYRGVDVSSEMKPVPEPVFDPADGVTIINQDEIDAANAANVDAMKIKYMVEEEARHVDIGIGLQEDLDGELIDGSAFDDALHGAYFLGFGSDENGDSNNIVSIVHRMGEILLNCDETSGEWKNDAEKEEFVRLAKKFDNVASGVKQRHTELSTEAEFIYNNTTLLENNMDALNEQIMAIEQVDLADAITSYSWAQYCYNAALKVGNSILSNSLMDYLS